MLASQVVGLSVNSDGVVEGVTKAKKSIASLGDSAKKSGKEVSDGMQSAGDSTKAAADKLDASTKRLIASIERQTLSVGKTKSEFYAAKAAIDGNEKALGPYIQKLAAAERAAASAGKSSTVFGDSLSTLKGRMVGLASIASAGLFVSWIKSSIDAADKMNDLAKTTGLTVEQLSGLRLAADQSGSDLEGTAKAIDKLSVNMAKNGEKFAALGITAKDPLKAFGQLSDLFISIEDPQRRAAVAATALGKSWEGAAPLLSEGSKSIEQMIKRGQELSGVTSDMAKNADEFNDKMSEMKLAATGFGEKIASDMLPGLIKITGAMHDAYEEGGKLQALWVGLGGVGTAIFTDDFLSDQGKYLQQVKHFNDEIERYRGYNTTIFGWRPNKDSIDAEIKKLEQQRDDLIKARDLELNPKVSRGGASNQQYLASQARVMDLLNGSPKEKAIDTFIKNDDGKTAAPKISEYEKLVSTLKDRLAQGYADSEAAANGYNNSQKEFVKLARSGAWEKLNNDERANVATIYEGIIGEEKRTDVTLAAQKKIQKAREDSHRAAKQEADDAGIRSKNIDGYIAKLLEEAETAGMSTSELAKYRDEHFLLSSGLVKGTAAFDLYITKINETRERVKDLNQEWEIGLKDGFNSYIESAGFTAKNMENVVTKAFKGMEDGLTDFVMTGKASFSDLTKSIIADMIRMVIQQQITGPLAAVASSFFASANGNAFSSGKTMAFANGGAFTNSIATRPTVAPMALFGEAGPEAIMPLTRNRNGRLGVEVSGGAGGAVNNVSIVINADGSQSENSNDSDAKELGRKIKTVVLDVLYQERRTSGSLARG